MTSRPAIRAALLALFALAAAAARADDAAREAGGLALTFNETYLHALETEVDLDTDDPMAVFSRIFANLDGEVAVLPTENYYYFAFLRAGVEWAGNLRLDVVDRDQGRLHFAYFERTSAWAGDGPTVYRRLGPDDGIAVRRTAPLVYDVTYRKRTVRFRLNDLSGLKPPAHALRNAERYIGPVYDESGVVFFLLYDTARKAFLYVLDESDPPRDAFTPLADAPRIAVGRRTGFAVYRDTRAERRILVGVHALNVETNSYLDGPFDQLPDNFVDGPAFRAALEQAYPHAAGKIDDYGNILGGNGRLLIAPYLAYRDQGELAALEHCAAQAADDAAYYRCLQPGGN